MAEFWMAEVATARFSTGGFGVNAECICANRRDALTIALFTVTEFRMIDFLNDRVQQTDKIKARIFKGHRLSAHNRTDDTFYLFNLVPFLVSLRCIVILVTDKGSVLFPLDSSPQNVS
jgi:hypothetical protein